MEQQILNDRQSSISIEKNSKGYNWTAKLYFDESKESHSEVIARLDRIDKELRVVFGG